MSSKKDTRNRLLDAALAALEEDPGNVNMGRVAELAGVSRQAVYLHFGGRGELLLAAARHVDDRCDLPRRLAPVMAADSPQTLLAAYAEFLASYNPLIYHVVCAAAVARRTDPEAAAASRDRLKNRRRGCYTMAERLEAWGELAPEWTTRTAGDWLTAQSSVGLWEELTIDLKWSRRRYVDTMTTAFRRALLEEETRP